jgi:hypothetical protein
LDAGPYTFIAADALTMKVREGGRVAKVACLVATGVNADGHREILGLDVSSTESAAGWLRKTIAPRTALGMSVRLRRSVPRERARADELMHLADPCLTQRVQAIL